MQTSDYTQHPEVCSIIGHLKTQAAMLPEGFARSAIRDDAGNQYVDLVMEGGGTLGVALLGYIYVLEQLDLRFLQVAGTSAGSIMAMLLAGGGPIAEAKSEWLIEKVASKDFSEFIDGNEEVQKFVAAMFDKDMRKAKKARLTVKVLDELEDHFGLNPGETFRLWMAELLHGRGVDTLDDLRAVRAAAPVGIRDIRTGDPVPPQRWERVSVVTAEVTTGTKVALPDMASLYWADPGSVCPADFVRASMSVPVFFYPFVAKNLPTGQEAQQRWSQLANYRGPIPPEAFFADGGSMSNFPISLFYKPGEVADAPVFGIKLGIGRDSYATCDSFGTYAGAMLNSMMAFHDNDFFVQHPELNRSVGEIDTGDYNWLDFHISEAGKLDLFVRGARAARDFLLQLSEPMRQ
ncbi:MAG: patatin-like phospholipase family protein [Saprospiraceae bacterium]